MLGSAMAFALMNSYQLQLVTQNEHKDQDSTNSFTDAENYLQGPLFPGSIGS